MKHRRYFIVLLVWLLGAAASFATLPFAEKIVTKRLASPPQISRAVDVLKHRTDKGIGFTKQLADALVKGKLPFELLSQSLGKSLQNEGVAIFLFQHDSLVFWSESMDISEVPEHSDRLVKVQNVWCTSYWMDSIKALALVKVKYCYPYENRFLENSFHPSLSFLKGYSISPLAVQGSFPISLYGVVPVFYLSHIPQDFSSRLINFKAVLSWIGFVSLFAVIFVLFLHPAIRKKGLLASALLTALLFGIRLASLYWPILHKGNWLLFKPEIFALGWFAPSVGDLLLNAVILFMVAAYAYKPLISVEKSRLKFVLGLIFSLLSFGLFLISGKLIAGLVLNSTVTLEAFKIFNLSVFSLVEYIIISLFYATAALFAMVARNSFSHKSRAQLFWLWLSIIVILFVLNLAFTRQWDFYGLLLMVVFALLFVHYKPKTSISHTYVFLLFILLLSIFSVWSVSYNASQKDKEIRQLLAINLANERDPIAEVNFPQLGRLIVTDATVKELLDKIEGNEVRLNEYINEAYLSGYFSKYDFQLTACLSTSKLHVENSQQVLLCYDFFEDMLNEYGIRIPGSSFYYLNNQNGRISYLGMLEYVLEDGSEACIYMELDSKLSKELLGYPELLIDKNVTAKRQTGEYSSAKYFQGDLIAFTGSYSYPLRNTLKVNPDDRYAISSFEGYNHLVYDDGAGTTIVLSRPNVNMFNVTASFTWVFLFFYLSITAWFALGRVSNLKQNSMPSFKNRIRFTMVYVLFLSLIMVGTVTITFSVKSFERKNLDSLNEKLVSVMVDMENNVLPHDMLRYEDQHYLTPYLIELSNVFHSDINLYDTHGELLATSRPEVFERNLFGRQMNPVAWHELEANHAAKLVHSESIGKLEYLSAYAPLINASNQKLGYLNLPYFTRQGEFIREVLSVIVALVNIYAFLILLAILIAVVISNKISKPLELIRQRIGTIDITRHIETIDYSGKDEVGQLVNEYNRMVVELAESARQLAQSQRQSAWREMAKQVAHEIKNPLTPIKLNLQLLVKAKSEGHPDWDAMFNRFSNTLSEQIDSLSGIASEFSNFAKMPVGQFANISLTDLLNESITLFSAYPNVELVKEGDFSQPYPIYADREQLLRVFVNLLKNAVQAIGRDEGGLIVVTLLQEDDWIRVAIGDNGSGIANELEGKIFDPNFTTKSGGTGLGLAISKNIVEVIGGKIWFENKPKEGATFIVELPSAKVN